MSASPLRFLPIAAALAAAAVLAGIAGTPLAVRADTAPTNGAAAANPPVPDTATTATPVPDDVGSHKHHHHRGASSDASASGVPSPSPSPTAPVYTSFTGTWEVQLQPGARTTYAHIMFDGTAIPALSGRLLRGTDATPIAGELDGDRFRLAGSDQNGAFQLMGYEEGATTMVGLFTQGATRIPFTATHQGGPGKGGGAAKHHHRSKKHGSAEGNG